MKESFSTSEVATYCYVTADTIRKWAEAGRIRVFKTPGGHRRIRREDLMQFLRDNGIPVHAELREAGLKILVVDSDNSIASTVRRFLERTNIPFLVEVAADGFEAGHQMAVFQPDVVFLDLGLPGEDGPALCRRIKSSPDYARVQIVAIAPPGQDDLFARSQEAGAEVSLKKPFTPDDLRRSLAQVGFEVG